MSTPGITAPAYLFYNAGTKIQETLQFDYPGRDPKVESLVAHWSLLVEPASFFEVPSMIMPEGRPVWTGWDQEIMKRHGGKRVVQVIATYVDNGEDLPIAATREEAVKKGRVMWQSYLVGLVQTHKDHVSEMRVRGLTALPAQGLTKYAIKTLGLEDPALDVQTAIERKENTSEVEALKAQLTAMQTQINNMTAQTKPEQRKQP
jgi:hypothetical protein